MNHVPQDIRRKETKKKIVDAAKLLFSQRDYFQTTSKDIARAASISIGSFYTYFDNKKEVIIEILSSYLRDSFIGDDETVGVSPKNDIEMAKSLRTIVNRCFALHDFSNGFYNNITMLSLSDEAIGLIYKEYEESMIYKIKELIVSYAPDIRSSQLDAAGVIVYSAMKGSIHNIRYCESSLNEAMLIDELVRFLTAYLMSTHHSM